jgi:hypothetical protein
MATATVLLFSYTPCGVTPVILKSLLKFENSFIAACISNCRNRVISVSIRHLQALWNPFTRSSVFNNKIRFGSPNLNNLQKMEVGDGKVGYFARVISSGKNFLSHTYKSFGKACQFSTGHLLGCKFHCLYRINLYFVAKDDNISNRPAIISKSFFFKKVVLDFFSNYCICFI